MRNWPGILIGVTLGMVVFRGALPALLPLLRFGFIFFVIYMALRMLKGLFFVRGAWSHLSREAARYQGSHGAAGSGGTTIDICPQCGDILEPRHRCRSPH